MKLLEKGFERHVFWNEYQTKIEARDLDNNNLIRFFLDASSQRIRSLFVLVFGNTDNGAEKAERNCRAKYFLPRVDITNYNVLIDERSFMINKFMTW